VTFDQHSVGVSEIYSTKFFKTIQELFEKYVAQKIWSVRDIVQNIRTQILIMDFEPEPRKFLFLARKNLGSNESHSNGLRKYIRAQPKFQQRQKQRNEGT